jgi:hypothetical protein
VSLKVSLALAAAAIPTFAIDGEPAWNARVAAAWTGFDRSPERRELQDSLGNIRPSERTSAAIVVDNGPQRSLPGEFVVTGDGVIAAASTPPAAPPQDVHSERLSRDPPLTFDPEAANKQTPISALSGVSQRCPSGFAPAEIEKAVAAAAQSEGVEERLALAIARRESGFDQSALSDKGAVGVMQLMPETATRFGVKDRCDVGQNIRGGVKYLRFLSDTFKNPILVMAVYNAGENRIYEFGSLPPYRETLNYVAGVSLSYLGFGDLPKKTLKAKLISSQQLSSKRQTRERDVQAQAAQPQTGWVGGHVLEVN